jgi:LysM domain
MSVVTHKPQVEAPAPRRVKPAVRRIAPGRPPTRGRVAGAPRVLARRVPERRAPRLSLAWMLAVASVACAAVVGLGALAGSMAPAGPSVPDETKVVRVLPGESLWELAGRVAPGADASAVVERIRELNGVEGAVEPGQPLTVPFSR